MTWPLQRDCNRYYGNPRGANGGPSAKWESANLVLVQAPWKLTYAGKPVKGIRIHKKCADSLKAVLDAIWERVGKSQAEIDRIGMSIYGGGYNFRLMRGGSSLSMHSYGCAVDFDPARNALGDKTPAMDRRVIEEFEREGWEWGGHWSRPDGMHFQAARTQAKPKTLESNPPRAVAMGVDFRAMMSGEVNSGTRALQHDLNAMGYFVGEEDGRWGGKTKGAIAAFKLDRGLEGEAIVDATLLADVMEARREDFTRPIAKERAEATPNILAEKLPEVAAAQKSSFWAKVQGWFSATFGTVSTTALLANVGDAKETVDGFKTSFFGDATGIAVGVLGVAAVVGLAVFFAKKAAGSANEAADASTAAYNVGARS